MAMINKVKKFLLDLLFPKFCFLCQREGDYICEDCKAALEISGFHQRIKTKYLSDLYFPCDYQKPIIKKIIQNFKYEPFVKELSGPLSSLIINHLQMLDTKPNFSDFLLVPVPLEKKRLKWRGFNQSKEMGKEIARFLRIGEADNVLIKTKETPPQMELSEEERKENIKGVFLVKNKELIKNKKILLIDDVYTTGATMEECARVLKEAGAKEIIGIVIARGN